MCKCPVVGKTKGLHGWYIDSKIEVRKAGRGQTMQGPVGHRKDFILCSNGFEKKGVMWSHVCLEEIGLTAVWRKDYSTLRMELERQVGRLMQKPWKELKAA